MVCEPKNGYSVLFECFRSGPFTQFVFLLIVLTAVQFDNEFGGWRIEIDYVIVDAVLTIKTYGTILQKSMLQNALLPSGASLTTV